MKIRAIWLEEADENTIFLQNHAQHMKNINTIWEIRKQDGNKIKRFLDTAELGVTHFKKIY